MEETYLKGYDGPREWCSEKIKLQSCFDRFSSMLAIVSSNKVSEIDILQHFVPQSNQLSENELMKLTSDSKASKLTTMFDQDLIKKTILSSKGTAKRKRSLSGDSDLDEQTFSAFPNGDKRKKNRMKSGQINRRKDLLIDEAEKRGIKNLVPYSDFLISFRIYEPFSHTPGERAKPGRCLQQISVLSHQKLSALRDNILCETEFQDTRGDISEHPDEPVVERARDVYHSSMFYFDNTFYVDCRSKCENDYSTPIKKWAEARGIKMGQTLAMESTWVEDLEIRFGYPYLFMHQGCCEHLVVINDARLLSPRDSLFSNDYPLRSRSTHLNMAYCMTCARFPAGWIVRGSARLSHDPTFMCKSCFKMLHYVNGKKVGNFKAWQYWQRSIIM